ncbi:DedA family protein [Bacillus sp. CGMCC 1.16607]|uniref:DedA family protein n=1 Tax=Bacillus sp. CGMCC 1.16607 TaxID=3351842 RepID=UPI003634053C
MELETLLQFIESHGYIGLFLWVWLGIFGLPIPNEILSMTVGMATSQEVLNPLITFFVFYAGIVAALTTCYLLGKYIGRPLIGFFEKRKRYAHLIDKSFRLIEKHHAFSLSISYFIPGVRNFVPFLYGFSKLPFRSFAIFSYSAAFIWLCITFILGYLFGDHIDVIIHYGKEFLIVIAVAFILFILIKMIRRRRRKKIEMIKIVDSNKL